MVKLRAGGNALARAKATHRKRREDMSATAATIAENSVLARILDEGWGPGAWHGPDLKAALADVSDGAAFWRPGEGRHNIAEIVLHHAYCVRNVRAQLAGVKAEPFVLEGDDWFELDARGRLPWPAVRRTLEDELKRLTDVVAHNLNGGNATTPLSDRERFNLVLGITCHAVYHAGQVQLIKRLQQGEA